MKKLLVIFLLIWMGFLFGFGVIVDNCSASQGEYKLIKSWGKKGNGDGEFNEPCGIAVDKNDYVYVVDSVGNRIQKLTSDGKFLCMWKTINTPRAIAVDNFGNVYVAEAGGEKGLIEKFTTEGKLIKKWEYKGSAYSMPGGITVSNNYVYLGNNSTGEVQKFTTEGELVKSWGNLARCCGFLDVAVDKEENLYVAELGAHRVVKFNSNGVLLKTWGKS